MNLPRNSLLTIYKSFFRPHLDCGDILYEKPNNEDFQKNVEKVQYKAYLAITEHQKEQRTSKEKNYDELDLHSLIYRPWHRKLVFFNKIVNDLLPDYLCSYLHPLRLAVSSKLRKFSSRIISFKNIFFPYCVNE